MRPEEYMTITIVLISLFVIALLLNILEWIGLIDIHL